jgi:hypothetical protein
MRTWPWRTMPGVDVNMQLLARVCKGWRVKPPKAEGADFRAAPSSIKFTEQARASSRRTTRASWSRPACGLLRGAIAGEGGALRGKKLLEAARLWATGGAPSIDEENTIAALTKFNATRATGGCT